ncbi:type I glyceraldehyde-3-phosphate dehydrogenase [Persicimonas caeni]|uniref:Glyceraldehyde-3-phosphate dehydrogenase n=1 Tax=Persicimonas caeni TaxID=2292766 RepID=A0A4Y6PMM9_PERCE|nr:type I glyceraldehyde-3-phosphate dehydrogenase [Persicimonas caeni]QDG49574.1 type I glyceraldehyde-3-phosphate dehydrogenase [Persicimonas caeni]QED30795.1 type I glyceraldehyde-3-phosphate dehydrogenase [Persicimonas caeni]
MAIKVAINGFGRIGRLAFRQFMEAEDLEVVAINDVSDPENLAYLLRHDSAHASPSVDVGTSEGKLHWGDQTIKFLSVRSPAELPWSELGVNIVLEASGVFTNREDAAKHLEAGAKRVIVSAPAKNADITLCMGVNEDKYNPEKHTVLSNASCTTNCLAPVAKVLDDQFGIASGFLTTVHAVTSSQTIVDLPHKKWRRGRAAMTSIVPTTTGAAVATTKVLPQLEGKMDGLAMRVPVVNGSIIDFVARTEGPVSVDSVNNAFREAAQSERLRGILGVSEEELVSKDIIGSPYSALIDVASTKVLSDDTVKVLAWYDNEWGYARRCVDLASYIAQQA